MKILAIGDSLALPGHGNLYEDTWIYKLKQAFPNNDFITFFRRQLTTDVLVTMGGGIDGPDRYPKGADCLEFYMPDVVIIQLGIVDSAPRLLYNWERFSLQKLPSFASARYIKIIKKYRERNINNTFVPPEKFELNIKTYLDRCLIRNVKRVLYVGICYPDKDMIIKNPFIGESVNLYNKILENTAKDNKVFKLIFPLDARKSNGIYADGYHPNQTGHELIFSAVSASLLETL
ncbi:MAG: SGNH/GDSL hydrolase family protein [Bacteroidia bacterium]|nr:SGNH/GDSL hydrolase family protein [Ignavibacteriaceae bacterium]MCK6648889.1 SGNH/GDSL hydrolase family protein [Bacteroidia bacterium]